MALLVAAEENALPIEEEEDEDMDMEMENS